MMKEMLQRRFARLVKETPREAAPVEAEVTAQPPPVSDAGAASDTPETLPIPAPVSPGEADDTFPSWPDLVLIDGGKGQLEAARQALAEIGLGEDHVALIGIAKGRDRDAGRETFFKIGAPPFKLPPRDPALYFVQRLRDEAHRFAIGAHRAKRKREMVKNPLDEIAGIGPTRKRALLHHFGTVKAIQRAALEDLMKAPGVNAATARAVYDFFHG
jgi:excinuclease ABC subunit C